MRRKRNIIVVNVGETEDSCLTDSYQTEEMFKSIGCEHLLRYIERTPTRLGIKTNTRPRPMKIELANEKVVNEIMARKHDLMYDRDFITVYINRDLNKTERERERDNRRSRKNGNTRSSESAGRGGQGVGAGGV